MTGHKCLLALVAMSVVAGACASRGGSDDSNQIGATKNGKTVNYVIEVHPSVNDGQCTVVEWTRERVKITRDGAVEFKVHNRCNEKYDLDIVDNQGVFDGQSPFTIPAAPGWSTLTLTVRDNVSLGAHKSDIKFRDRLMDPDWEVDP